MVLPKTYAQSVLQWYICDMYYYLNLKCTHVWLVLPQGE